MMRKKILALVTVLGISLAAATPANAWYGGWGGYGWGGGWGYGGAAIGAMAGAAVLGGMIGAATTPYYYGGYYAPTYYYPQTYYVPVAPQPRRVIIKKRVPVQTEVIEEDYYGW